MDMKNIKIDDDTHTLLKEHCDEYGYKMGKLVENLIKKQCRSWKPSDGRLLLVDGK